MGHTVIVGVGQTVSVRVGHSVKVRVGQTVSVGLGHSDVYTHGRPGDVLPDVFLETVKNPMCNEMAVKFPAECVWCV